jgi:hypothetical protein
VIGHGSEGATALFDMDGFVVRAHVVEAGEWWLQVETTSALDYVAERRTRITVASATWPFAEEIVYSTIAP